jgi:CSLREA domain-containing protein
MSIHTARRLGMVGVLGTIAALLVGAPALGAVIRPNTFADENGGGTACSLREAILAANTDTAFGGCRAGGGADTIPLATGIYALSIPRGATGDDRLDGDLYVASPLTITHAGVTPAVVDGGRVDRVIHVYGAGNLTASGVTIRNGRTSMSGGGIRNEGNLDLSNATVSGNETTASYGGGIANAGPATMSLTNVTLSGNRAEGDGGGIDQGLGGLANLNHVTIAGNTADTDGDAGGGGGVLVAPGTVSNPVGTFNFRNTIIAGNTDISPPSISESPDCGGILISQGNNLIGDPTRTLLAKSPAINAGGGGSAPIDQRGVPRSAPDIGAYEFARCGGVVVNLVGTSGEDWLVGTSSADGILGLGGRDILKGRAGKDGLCGGGGRDKLKGGRGKDTLIGGKGKDVCRGGPGKDTQKSC